MSSTEPPETQTAANQFYDGALRRIRRFLLVLGGIGLVGCLFVFGWVVAAGFVAGAIIAYVNHVWLERVASALGERITSGQSHERGASIATRTILRYAFIALGAYVIFRVSLAGLYGFLGGICLTIVAIACEAAVEVFVGLRRGL